MSKIELPKDLDDKVIGPIVRKELKTIENRFLKTETTISNSGRRKKSERSVRVIFDGPSGTGKTISAELLSKSLGLDLYRIDLSRVVSKYIGETEKNLENIFSRAANMKCILFFDEADALFGKRTDVKDSHDRYANIDTSYLLARIEEFNGVVILATNMKSNIDDAFLRRFQTIVHFP